MGLSGFKVDIAVFNPKDQTKAVMGIMLDGHRWNARNTVNDRDLLPVAVLENKMGWPLVERIKAAFETAKTIKPEAKKAPEPKEETQNEEQPQEQPENKDAIANLPQFTQAPVMPTGEQEDLDNLGSREIQAAIRSLAADITSFEGPVSATRLANFIGAAFGYTRITAKRIQSILSVGFVGHATDQEGFIYPKGIDPNAFKDFKAGEGRHPDEISLNELANIMNHICKAYQGCRKEQLIKVTSTALGISRQTTQIQTRLTLAIAQGIGTGRLVKQGEYLIAN